MDKNWSIEELKSKVQSFCEKRDWDQFHSPKELAIGMSTEANELLEIFRFQTDEQMRELLKQTDSHNHIEQELADTFFFILRFAQLYQIDLTEALEKKMKKNAERYTVEKSKGRNQKISEKTN